MKKNLIIAFLSLFIIYDTLRSFNQHLHMPLDGDLALIALPADVFKKAMKEPFGIEAAFQNKNYHATNRAFAHWTMYLYFQTAPFIFQLFSSPLESIYLSAALAKILFQLLICYMLTRYSKPHSNSFSDLIIAMAILTPLFQTGGFNSNMGIIDQSITYSFFYALPLGLLLVFFYPFYRLFLLRESLNFSIVKHIIYFLLILLLSFNGPLIPAIATTLVLCVFGFKFFYYLSRKRNIGMTTTENIYLLLFGLIALYSLYVGTFNSENFSTPMPLDQRYLRLVAGFKEIFFSSVSLPILLVFITINMIILRKQKADFIIWQVTPPLILFCLVYFTLLPLGGYRIYRPNILRNDTALPILICCFYSFLNSTLSVLALSLPLKRSYIFGLIVFLLFFHFSDSHISSLNTSEKKAILEIAASEKHNVVIHDYCTIMSYRPIIDSNQSSMNTLILQRWNVLKSHKLYYQEY